MAVAVVVSSLALAPPANARMPLGNYTVNIEGRYDFHTWLWAVAPCTGDCVYVTFVPQPVARAFAFSGPAQLANGTYTLVTDNPYGLRCDNVYYGPTILTRDVYTWNATTLIGSIDSTFDTNCGGVPGGTYTYPFTLTRF
jgi:hypothetical protein